MNNFVLSNVDTDSVSIRKPDGSYISKEERKIILDALNAEFPEKINFTDDGYFCDFIVLAAKNYIMKSEDGKVKLKGSSLKDSKMEPIIKQMNQEFINALLDSKSENLLTIYIKYIMMVSSIQDIRPWAKKVTISSKTLTSDRENEAKPRRAIEGTDYVEGDRIWVYYTINGELKLIENYSNDHDEDRLYERLYKALQKFAPVMDLDLFLNFKLKKNKPILNKLLNEKI